MAKMHEYPVSVSWEGGRGGSGLVKDDKSGIEAALAVGEEFGGTGQGTNPEQLLAMSVASCYSITFGIIADNRKLPLADLQVTATGHVEENGPQFTYKKITISPKITLEAGADDAQMKMAEDMAHKADSYCIITNVVRAKLEIEVKPEILIG